MKRAVSFFVLVAVVALAQGFPGRRDADGDESSESVKPNTDTVLVLPGNRYPMRPMFSGIPEFDDDSSDELTPFGGGFGVSPFRTDLFDGLLNQMQSAMKRLREQMAGAFSGAGGFIPWGKIPEGANTTSTTKVIDGHVVTINETVYKGDSDDGNSFFRIRIVDVKPENDNTTEPEQEANSGGEVTDKPTSVNKTGSNGEREETTTTPARSVETVEDLGNNEIPDNQVDTLKA